MPIRVRPSRDPRSAQPLSQRDLQSALNTRLAYVVSGDPEVDEESKAGLTTLSQVLAQRTSLIPGDARRRRSRP